jgi:2-polyprenyl-3-methyl-5-hydroxy-6-metoxy-1,4-benzoquinol methylase
MRIARVLPHLKRYPHCTLLDVGCGVEAKLLRELEPHIEKGVGIDFKAPRVHTAKIQTIVATLDDKLPFETGSFDVVTMLAVLEHLEKPDEMLREIARVLRVGGGLILTVPSKYAQPVLEFLAFRIGLVNADEIRDHKRYFNREDLCAAVAATGLLNVEQHKYFQWRFNNFLFAVKHRTD